MKSGIIFVVFLILAYASLGDCSCRVRSLRSCADVKRRFKDAESGVYNLQTSALLNYTVYCDFYPCYMYTYIQPHDLSSLNIDRLFNNKKEVIIKHRLDSGEQREVKYGQIQKYRARDISVQYNANVGYQDFLNTDMGPYIYVGLLPVVGIDHRFDFQGYSVNGRDYVFFNCDGNPNNYFVLLYNKDDVAYNGYQVDRPFMRRWIEDSTLVPAERHLPVEFFSLFEMHMGGCGGYLTTDRVTGMTGATIGLRYDLPIKSCKDVFDKAGSDGPISGEYYLLNDQDQPYKVYCEFYDDHFYTFIAPTSLESIPVSDLYNNRQEVLIRFRRQVGTQRQSTFGQITKYQSRDISIQYNAAVGYNPIRNSQMDPYLYVGLLPIAGINHNKDLQGYSVNGQDKTFINCDANPNSYFALLYNADNADPVPYLFGNNFMRQWYFDSQPVDTSRYLPENYFSFFEMHMGGCGGYLALDGQPDLSGVVFGLKYDL